jgi:Kdo2-lipid IVA lauroyltransferase/acyltransferase
MPGISHTLAPVRVSVGGVWLHIRRARRLLFYVIVRVLVAVLRGIPSSVARLPLRGLAQVAWWTRPGDRRIALRQLELAFPLRAPAWRRWVARTALSRLADNLVSNLRDDEPLWISPESADRLGSLGEQGRPVLVLMGHYGAWELVGPALASLVPPFAALTANPHNHRLDAWLRRQRLERGVQVFDRHRERLSAARWLRRGGTLALLADHRSSAVTRRIPWFGRPAPTVIGPARLARWARASIVAICVKGGPGHYELEVGPILDDAESRSEEDVLRWCNECSEAWIVADPTQWTWWHDRYGFTEECHD